MTNTETLRHNLAFDLNVAPEPIDLVELRRAGLAMRARIAEKCIFLAGQDPLAWSRFLQRTWREFGDFYWSKQNAA